MRANMTAGDPPRRVRLELDEDQWQLVLEALDYAAVESPDQDWSYDVSDLHAHMITRLGHDDSDPGPAAGGGVRGGSDLCARGEDTAGDCPGSWHGCDCHDEGEEPEPDHCDPGPEAGDEGGMSEHRSYAAVQDTWGER